MKKICIITTHPIILTSFFRPHIFELSKMYDITIICNTNLGSAKYLESFKLPSKIISLGIQREINIMRDLISLIQIMVILFREKFDVVHTLAPKAGLLVYLQPL